MTSRDEEIHWFWIALFVALCADIVLRLIDRFSPPQIISKEQYLIGGTTGTSSIGSSVQSGTVTIPTGYTSISIPHTLTAPKILCTPNNFVMWSVSGDTVYIDAPQAVPINFDWMAI